MDMPSPSEFDKSLDSTESVSEDRTWDEASTTSEIDENEKTNISSSAMKSTRKHCYMESEEGAEVRLKLQVVEQHSIP